MRIEPPVSVPSAAGTSRAATAAPEPLLEPPGRRPGAHGFAGVPSAGLTPVGPKASSWRCVVPTMTARSEEHTSELQSRSDLVCRLLLEKKKRDRGQADDREASRVVCTARRVL